MNEVVIVDYGAGNLRSVQRAVERTGIAPCITDDRRIVERARALIVPGVGAAADTMRNLRAHGMVEPIQEWIAAERPFLGVCMGMQALFSRSDEDGGQQCLGIIAGDVIRFPDQPGLKIPHMGWNTVRQKAAHWVFDGVPDNSYFYFVHGYHGDTTDPDVVIGEAEYGRLFPAVVAQGNLVATQFHPEKSSTAGLRIYANFLRFALGEHFPFAFSQGGARPD